MQVRFELGGPDAERELRSLHQWLGGDRELRGHAGIEPAGREPQPDEMGAAFDAVVAVLSALSGAGQLAVSYAAWRDARRPRSEVTVVVTGGTEEAVRAVRRALDEAEDGE